MILQSIYLLFNNNITCLLDLNYSKEFIKTFFQLLVIYSGPYMIFNIIINLSNNTFINYICNNIYYYLYHVPSFSILYLAHNSKLLKLLEIRNISHQNPNHSYISSLYTFVYIALLYISSIFYSFFWIRCLCDALSFSLFYNEIGYQFLDNSIYQYSNKVDFYNYNWIIFIFYGFITSYILYFIPENIFIPLSYIIVSIFQNIFIDYRYHKQSNKHCNIQCNLLYIFEMIFNKLVTIVSTFLLYTMNQRKMLSNCVLSI